MLCIMGVTNVKFKEKHVDSTVKTWIALFQSYPDKKNSQKPVLQFNWYCPVYDE